MAIGAIDNDPQLSSDMQDAYVYYPNEWVTPYIERRRKVGWDLYGLLGIAKGEKQRMHQQHGRNDRFFDALVGLLFTVDKVLDGRWHVFAKRHAGSTRARFAHLPAGRIPERPQCHLRNIEHPRRSDAGVWHEPWLRRPHGH